jgi:hypothetical protein
MKKNKEKYIFFMPAGEMQYAAVNFFKQYNFKIILCDANPKAFLKSQADIFLNFDIFDIKECEKKFYFLRKKINIVAAYTSSSDCHKSIAHISEIIGSRLTWNKRISNLCSDKYKSRKFLTNLCQQPLYALISHPEDIKLFDRDFGLREVVIKPLDSSGSRGFQTFKNIRKIAKKDFYYTQSYSRLKKIIIEEKVSRTIRHISEISVEAIYYQGNLKIVNIVDRFFFNDIEKINNLKFLKKLNLLEGMEIGHSNPSMLPKSIILKIKKIYKKIFKKLNVNKKLVTLKLDILIDDKDEPIVLEMTPRTSGGWDSCYSNIVTGGNLLKNLLLYIMGMHSALKTYNSTLSYDRIQKKVFVLAIPSDMSPNCIGRKFFAGNVCNINTPLQEIVDRSLIKFKNRNKIEPINII